LFRGRKGNGKTVTLKKLAQRIQEEAQQPDKLHILFLNMLYKKFADSFLRRLEGEDNIDIILSLLRNAILDNDSSILLQGSSLGCYLNEPSKMKDLSSLYKFYDDKKIAEHMDANRIDTMRNLFRHLKENKHKTYLFIDNIALVSHHKSNNVNGL